LFFLFVVGVWLAEGRRSWKEAYSRDGFIIVRGFASSAEVFGMRNRMSDLATQYWHNESARANATLFTTDESQLDRQAKSSYFLGSAKEIRFFEEKNRQALNKVGHALHIHDSVFATYTNSKKVQNLAYELGYNDPVVPQSMYIFKSALSGGAVTSHQDATFLRTFPRQTVAGFWLALDDATIDNGCLWIRNASHREPTRRFFIRQKSPNNEVQMKFTTNFSNTQYESFYLDDRWVSVSNRLPHDHVPWEGSDLTAQQASHYGFFPVPVKAGDLIVFAGTLDHLSLPNSSPHDRHTFQLHIIEGEANYFWCDSNWLQYHENNHLSTTNSENISFCDDSSSPLNTELISKQPAFPRLLSNTNFACEVDDHMLQTAAVLSK